MKYLLSALLTIITCASAFGQAYVINTADFQVLDSGNSVWITKTDVGKPVGSVYARGWTPGFLSAIEFFSIGGSAFNWKFTNNQLYFAPSGYNPPLVNGLYLCNPPNPPEGSKKYLLLSPVIGGASVNIGALTATLGQSIVVPIPGPDYGVITFPSQITAQVRIRLVSH